MISQNSGNSKKPEPSTSTLTFGLIGRQTTYPGIYQEDVMKMSERCQEYGLEVVRKKLGNIQQQGPEYILEICQEHIRKMTEISQEDARNMVRKMSG